MTVLPCPIPHDQDDNCQVTRSASCLPPFSPLLRTLRSSTSLTTSSPQYRLCHCQGVIFSSVILSDSFADNLPPTPPHHPDHPDQARAADPRGQLLAVSSHQGVLRGDHDQVLNSWHHLIQVGNCNMMTKIFIYIILIFSQSHQSINKVSQVSKSGS